MLKTVVLPNIFAEKYFFLDSLINDSKEQHLFEIEIFCRHYKSQCNVSFDPFNASLLNKAIIIKKSNNKKKAI